jgi:hypothetical protein
MSLYNSNRKIPVQATIQLNGMVQKLDVVDNRSNNNNNTKNSYGNSNINLIGNNKIPIVSTTATSIQPIVKKLSIPTPSTTILTPTLTPPSVSVPVPVPILANGVIIPAKKCNCGSNQKRSPQFIPNPISISPPLPNGNNGNNSKTATTSTSTSISNSTLVPITTNNTIMSIPETPVVVVPTINQNNGINSKSNLDLVVLQKNNAIIPVTAAATTTTLNFANSALLQKKQESSLSQSLIKFNSQHNVNSKSINMNMNPFRSLFGFKPTIVTPVPASTTKFTSLSAGISVVSNNNNRDIRSLAFKSTINSKSSAIDDNNNNNNSNITSISTPRIITTNSNSDINRFKFSKGQPKFNQPLPTYVNIIGANILEKKNLSLKLKLPPPTPTPSISSINLSAPGAPGATTTNMTTNTNSTNIATTAQIQQKGTADVKINTSLSTSTSTITKTEEIVFTMENTAEWGIPTWIKLHKQAAHYPKHPTQIERDMIRSDIQNTMDTIPCPTCNREAHNWMKTHPLDHIALKDRYTLSNWVLDFHNGVNVRLGKREWTLQEMAYEHGLTNLLF